MDYERTQSGRVEEVVKSHYYLCDYGIKSRKGINYKSPQRAIDFFEQFASNTYEAIERINARGYSTDTADRFIQKRIDLGVRALQLSTEIIVLDAVQDLEEWNDMDISGW